MTSICRRSYTSYLISRFSPASGDHSPRIISESVRSPAHAPARWHSLTIAPARQVLPTPKLPVMSAFGSFLPPSKSVRKRLSHLSARANSFSAPSLPSFAKSHIAG